MPLRTILHSAVLALVNLASVWLGFIVFSLTDGANQLGVQSVVAVAATVTAFLAWANFADSRSEGRLQVRGWRDGGWIIGLGFVLAAVVCLPAHYLRQGYLTAFSNVAALWAFQAVANSVAVLSALRVAGSGRSRIEPNENR